MDGDDEDEDAFSDDSAAYMEDIMMLRADRDQSEAPANSGGAGAGAGAGVGGASVSDGGGGRRAGIASGGGSVSGGAVSVEEGGEDDEEEDDEEEFSEPGEDAPVDDETTLLEVRTAGGLAYSRPGAHGSLAIDRPRPFGIYPGRT